MIMKIKIFNYTIRITKNRGPYYKKRKWSPPSALEAPDAPDGYRHRWIRSEMLKGRWGIKKSKDAGWDLVKPKRSERHLYPTVTEGKFKGCIGAGGLILARFPERYLP